MGYVFDFKEAGHYDAWFSQPGNRHYFDLEIKLILDLMDLRPGQRVLDIGCGTGMSLLPLLDRGLSLTGVDPSTYMLDVAHERLGSRVDLHRCPAEALPFEDNAFETALFFTSLEFTDRPAKAIEEACRVAREQVVIGVLNRHAPVNVCRRCKGFVFPSIYSNTRFSASGNSGGCCSVFWGMCRFTGGLRPSFRFFGEKLFQPLKTTGGSRNPFSEHLSACGSNRCPSSGFAPCR